MPHNALCPFEIIPANYRYIYVIALPRIIGRWYPALYKKLKVTIVVPRAFAGYGDLTHPVALATCLPRHLSIAEVRLTFEDPKDSVRAKKIMPDIERDDQPWKIVNGSADNVRTAISSADVCIKMPVGLKHNPFGPISRPSLDEFMTHAPINIYLEEYDPKENFRQGVQVPEILRGRGVVTDAEGRKHVAFKTGLAPDALGIHVLKDIPRLSKQQVLKLFEESGIHLRGSGIEATPWAVIYAQQLEKFFAYYRHLYDALRSGKMDTGPISLFDVNYRSSKALSFGCYLTDRSLYWSAFTNVYYSKTGEIEQVDEGVTNPQVTVHHVGNVKRTIFLGILANAGLPSLLTGDMSVSEAVSLDRLWLYENLPHKALAQSYCAAAARFLNLADLNRATMIFGAGPILTADQAKEIFLGDTYRNRNNCAFFAPHLFYAAEFQAAQRRLNAAIRKELNLSRNLAAEIKKLI